LKPDKEHERENLSAMGVSGQLQVHMMSGCICRTPRLVRQQNSRNSQGRSGESQVWARLMGGMKVPSVEIGDARHNERVGPSSNHPMLIVKHDDTQAPELRFPSRCAMVVLVVTGHEEHALGRAQVGETRDAGAQLGDIPVDQIPRNRYHVWLEGVHPFDESIQSSLSRAFGHVKVAQLDDSESLEGCSEG